LERGLIWSSDDDSLTAVLSQTIERGPILIEYELMDRERRGWTLRAHGVIQCRPWRSSLDYEFFSIASDGQKEWRGQPSDPLAGDAEGPAQLLEPLWLLGCLFGAVDVQVSSSEAAPSVDSVELLVECDLERARAATHLALPTPPDGTRQKMRVTLSGPRRDLTTIEGEAHLGHARMRLLQNHTESSRLRWDRISALTPAETAGGRETPRQSSVAADARGEDLVPCTEDIDAQIATAVHKAWEAEGLDPDQPPDPEKSEASLERFARENEQLIAELARRYRKVMPPPEDESLPDSVYLVMWMCEHTDRLHD